MFSVQHILVHTKVHDTCKIPSNKQCHYELCPSSLTTKVSDVMFQKNIFLGLSTFILIYKIYPSTYEAIKP